MVLCGCAAAPRPASIQATTVPLTSPPPTAGIPMQGGAPATAAPRTAPATPVPASWCRDLPAEPPETTPRATDDQSEDAGEAQSPDALNLDTTMPLTYDQQSNTILLNQAGSITLAALSSALGRPELLRELAPGEWILNANLRIGKGASLTVAGPSVRRLKLRSDAQGFTWIKAFDAQLTFVDTCVTSWDSSLNNVDTNDADGRSFVLARGGSRMDIRGSELSYLGYYANESYGVAWRQEGTSGEAINSRFGHNFYGLYSYEASNLVIRSNEVHHNVRYGIDPHTRSNRLLIEGNTAHHNGKQGIILAEECTDSIVRGNTVYANDLHGIVLYKHSNNNLVENNISYGNGLQGININDSSNNTLRGNTTYANAEAGIGVGQQATNNVLEGNLARDNAKDGIYFYSDASGNTLRDNIVRDNLRYGIYVKSADNTIASGNQVFGNTIGIYLNVKPAPEVSLEANRIYDNRDENVRVGGG
jgi:parallel beta-helix repeat protein